MHPTQLRWIAFGLYLFSQFGGSTSMPIVPNFAFLDPGDSERTPFAILPGGSSAVSAPATLASVSTHLVTIARSTAPPDVGFFTPQTIIIAGSMGAVILVLGVCLCALMRSQWASLRSVSSENQGKLSQELGRVESDKMDAANQSAEMDAADPKAVNRASWALYLTEIQSPQPALTYSNTISTQRLYISNQVKRARQKELEISGGYSGSESLGENVNPFGSGLGVKRASWGTYRTESSEDTLAAASTTSTRELYISNLVNRAQEQVTALEEISALLRSSSRSSGASSISSSSRTYRGVQQPVDAEQANGPGDPESHKVQDKLERAMHQINVLNSRMRELERSRRSSRPRLTSAEPRGEGGEKWL
ncbi:hypothetical protein B0H17DRAFT_1071313 [Mycena rosella]|uniref:Peroxin-14 n=1 Tax=Mycena rosella TaxID=1033263 RepID=A0AAD7GFT8_MYCRO|nr:hypothetical protein B0H17DRAFT_1071313 [Mycena rosella]